MENATKELELFRFYKSHSIKLIHKASGKLQRLLLQLPDAAAQPTICLRVKPLFKSEQPPLLRKNQKLDLKKPKFFLKNIRLRFQYRVQP